MKKNSLKYLTVLLTLILLVTACAPGEEGTVTPGEPLPGDVTGTPFPLETETQMTETETTATAATLETTPAVETTGTPVGALTTQTPGIPVTGAESILLECQFCIDDMAHALLVFPDTATFEVVNPAATVSEPGLETGCTVVDTYNGRQVVLCRAEENTSMTLNICADGNNCTELLVELQTCPDTAGPLPALTGTPELEMPTSTMPADVTVTPVLAIPTATP